MSGLFKKTAGLLVILLMLSFPVLGQSEEDFETELLPEETVELGEIDGSLISEIINFVRERDPVIKTQKEVMDILESMYEEEDLPEEGEELPEYIKNSLQEEELNIVFEKQEAQEKYTEISRSLVTELLKKISRIFEYKNTIENQKELHELLLSREENTRRQVEAGIMDPQDLQNLSEQIIEVRTNLSNAELNMGMLKMEIALNYGNEDWEELYELLEKLEDKTYN